MTDPIGPYDPELDVPVAPERPADGAGGPPSDGPAPDPEPGTDRTGDRDV